MYNFSDHDQKYVTGIIRHVKKGDCGRRSFYFSTMGRNVVVNQQRAMSLIVSVAISFLGHVYYRNNVETPI